MKLSLTQVKEAAAWASASKGNWEKLWGYSMSPCRRTSVNSLWIMTHAVPEDNAWMIDIRDSVILRLLDETDASKKRIFLQLLRDMQDLPDSPYAISLLDYCFSKINSECEPYAVRCFSLYVAFRISKEYPELICELEQHIELLSLQPLSPGLKSGMRQVKEKISRLKRKMKYECSKVLSYRI